MIIAARLLEETKKAMAGKPVELEPDEYWGVAVPCNVELMALLAEQRWVGAIVPDLATVRAWKQTYLAIWDASIDGLAPDLAWKQARRTISTALGQPGLCASECPPALPKCKGKEGCSASMEWTYFFNKSPEGMRGGGSS